MAHFQTKEDDALILSWIIASNDPIRGKDQKGSQLWKRIMQEFVKRWPQGKDRDKKSLQSRCNTLRGEVRKYVSLIRPYFRNKPSGLNEQDYYRIGTQNYEAARGKRWIHESVFQLLKTYQPDYNPEMNNDVGPSQATQPSQATKPSTSAPVTIDEDLEDMARFGSSSTQGSDTSDISRRRRYFEQTDDVRSSGRDKAKKKARETKASERAYDKMHKIIQLLESAQAQRVAKYETEEEFLNKNMEKTTILAQTQQRESDLKILRQNLNEVQEWEIPLYKKWRNEILVRNGLEPIP
ncbi:glutathione S-transferase T3-like [Papaver somniferum]|uniref:glutathione S-transferase T3-like n=1 Tax=Papaver somniferum TaxID=3469 RepID=UPI000E6FAF82|nr:glutathione S-transferase T3-like [Papaver somniferum]